MKPPIRKPTGEWARSEHEKAELFAQHFKEVFKPHSDDLNPDIENYLDSPLQITMPIKNFTFTEVQQQIQNLKESPRHRTNLSLAARECGRVYRGS
jgi:hypothetical protein